MEVRWKMKREPRRDFGGPLGGPLLAASGPLSIAAPPIAPQAGTPFNPHPLNPYPNTPNPHAPIGLMSPWPGMALPTPEVRTPRPAGIHQPPGKLTNWKF